MSGLLRYITNQTDVIDAMNDAALVVSVYPHVDKFHAYMMRLKKLCQNEKLERACNLLLCRKEDGSCFDTFGKPYIGDKDIIDVSEESVPSEDTKGSIRGSGDFSESAYYEQLASIESECSISLVEALSLGQGLMIWLVEILSACIEKANRVQSDDNEDFTFPSLPEDSSVRGRYKWAVKAAAKISSVLCEIREQVIDAQPATSVSATSGNSNAPNLNLPGFSHSTTPSISEIVAGSALYGKKPSATVFGYLQALYLEFGVMMGWESYQSAIVRRRCLRKISKTVFFQKDDEGNNGKGKSVSKHTLSNEIAYQSYPEQFSFISKSFLSTGAFNELRTRIIERYHGRGSCCMWRFPKRCFPLQRAL